MRVKITLPFMPSSAPRRAWDNMLSVCFTHKGVAALTPLGDLVVAVASVAVASNSPTWWELVLFGAGGAAITHVAILSGVFLASVLFAPLWQRNEARRALAPDLTDALRYIKLRLQEMCEDGLDMDERLRSLQDEEKESRRSEVLAWYEGACALLSDAFAAPVERAFRREAGELHGYMDTHAEKILKSRALALQRLARSISEADVRPDFTPPK